MNNRIINAISTTTEQRNSDCEDGGSYYYTRGLNDNNFNINYNVINDKSNNDKIIATSSNASCTTAVATDNNNDDIVRWSKFCESVFNYKSNPPSYEYFLRHYINDPYRFINLNLHSIINDSSGSKIGTSTTSSSTGAVSTTTLLQPSDLIRVMVFHEKSKNKKENFVMNNNDNAPIADSRNSDNDSIVSSCRIFQRFISLGGNDNSSMNNNNINTSNNSQNGKEEQEANKKDEITSSLLNCANDNNKKQPNSCFWFVGGIGEVCTDSKHRNRGLSKILLEDCIQIMSLSTVEAANTSTSSSDTSTSDISQTHCSKVIKMNASLLHAGPDFFPVYRKRGYVNVTTKWSLVHNVNMTNMIQETLQSNNMTNSHGYTVRGVSFPNDTEQLKLIHQSFSESRLVGCVIRTTTYWNEYISQELKNNFFCLTRGATTSSSPSSPSDGQSSSNNEVDNHWNNNQKKYEKNNNIIAFLSIRPRSNNNNKCDTASSSSPPLYQICEFGCNFNEITTYEALKYLLPSCIIQHNPQKLNNPPTGFISLHIPTFMINDMTRENNMPFKLSNIEQKNDDGWMYHQLSNNLSIHDIIMNNIATSGTATTNNKKEHFIWPSDSF